MMGAAGGAHGTGVGGVGAGQGGAGKIKRDIDLFLRHWGEVKNADLPLILHLLKIALLVTDEPSVRTMVEYLQQHGRKFDLSQLSSELPLPVYHCPPALHWMECVVPYPAVRIDYAYEEAVDSDGARHRQEVPLTHPSAQAISNAFRGVVSSHAQSGAIPETMLRLELLQHQVASAENAHQGLNPTLSAPVMEQIRAAQDQCINEAVRQLAKNAIMRCAL
jgi:hypothetical protein